MGELLRAILKHPNRTILLLLSTPLLILFAAGCGDFWQAPSTTTSGSCTTNCTTATSGSFYILNAGTTPEVVGETIVTGAPTAISGSPWALEGSPYSMAIAPNGDFLIVSTTSGVFAYPITNGVLGTAVVVSTDQASAVQVDATDSWLIEAIAGTGEVTMGAIPIESTTGAGTGTEQTVSFTVASAVVQTNRMVISPDNQHIFVPLGAGGTIVVPFTAGVTAGSNPLGTKAPTIAVANANGSALSVAVDPSTTPRLFYIGESLADSAGTSGGLRVYNYDSLGSGNADAGHRLADCQRRVGAEFHSAHCIRRIRLRCQWNRVHNGGQRDRIHHHIERSDDSGVYGCHGHGDRGRHSARGVGRGLDQHVCV